MSKRTRVFLAMLCFMLAVYAPVSLFVNIPPFDTNEILYVYEPIPEPDNIFSLPDVRAAFKQGGIVKSTSPIENPEYYQYRFKRTEVNYIRNPWFGGTIPIFVVGVLFGAFVLSWSRKKKQENIPSK